MAESLVLADLSLDASGMLAGAAASNTALTTVEKSLVRFDRSQRAVGGTTDLVVRKMVNLRGALTGVARAFGIAGLITGAAIALKGLVSELITSTNWFKRSAETITDWWNALAKGEGVVERLARKLPGGTPGLLAQGQSLIDRAREIRRLQENQREVNVITGIPGLGMLPLVSGKPGEGTPFEKRILGIEAIEVQRTVNQLIDRFTALGLSEKEVADGLGLIRRSVPPTRDELERLQKIAAEGLGGTSAIPTGRTESALAQTDRLLASLGLPPPELFNDAVQEVLDSVGRLNQNKAAYGIDVFSKGVDTAAQRLMNWGLTAEDVAERLQSVGVVWTQVGDTIQKTSEWMNLATAAATQFAGAIAQAFTRSSGGVKKFFADLLAAMVPTLLGFAAVSFVRGFFGEPHMFAIAKFAAGAAVAAAVASRALGGSGGDDYGSRNFGAELGGAAAGGQRGPQQVTVVVHGYVGDNAALAREISRALRTAESDGA